MLIRKNILIVLSLTAIIVVSACGGRGTPDIASTLAPIYTAAAQTLQALTTQIAVTPNIPYITSTPTYTPIVPLPTLTQPTLPAPAPWVPPAVTRCDWVGFLGDVSVPDGSIFAPSTSFTKTWRLRNIGSCTWTTTYALVFSSGLPMGGPAAINLPVSIAPGQIVDLPVNLTAPTAAGHYRGNWMLQNPSGVKFGIGNQANAAFWVDINVAASGQNVTTTTITADNPDPSTPGQSVAVSATVSGSGTSPTGTVAITGADTNCTITLSSGSGSCNVSFSTAGSKTLMATYSGDGNYAVSSGTAIHTVSTGATSSTTTITIDAPDPSTPGQSVAVSVTVSGTGITPTGTVAITGADTNCTITLSSGNGSCSVVFTTAGARLLTATYSGDANYAGSSSTASHTVSTGTVSTTTTINFDTPDPSNPGQWVAVSVTVSGAGGTPSGMVTITGADTNCTITLAGGSGSCNVVFTIAGARGLTATYSGDANYAGSSDTASHTVSKGSSTTTITADTPDPSAPGQTVAVSVTVSGAGAAPTGTVTITGVYTNCTITLSGGIGSCNVVFNTAGTETLTATYNGDANYAGSLGSESHSVKYATTTTITTDTPDPSTAGGSVAVSVTVIGGGGSPSGTVVITGADTNCTITLVGGSGSCAVVFSAIGTYTLTATYNGDAYYLVSQDTESHTVSQGPSSTTTITAVFPVASAAGGTVTVSVTVSGAGPTPTGTVTISGADAPCIITLVGGSGSCNVVFSAPGTFTLTATYSGDLNYAGSSDTESHTVN
jgi:hypothetical protein